MPPELLEAPPAKMQVKAKKPSRFARNTPSDDVLLIGFLAGLDHQHVFPTIPRGRAPAEGTIRCHLKASLGVSPGQLDELIFRYRRGERTGVAIDVGKARK